MQTAVISGSIGAFCIQTAREHGLWHVVTRRAGGTHPVYGLRLPTIRIEQLRRLAEARGVEPSVLARQWVIDQLDAAEQARDEAEERWERDLHATTDHLRQLLDERPGDLFQH
jgi:hypothetical protein